MCEDTASIMSLRLILTLEILVLSWTTTYGVEGSFSSQFTCSRYKFFYLQHKTWQQSMKACENDNGTLLCIETKEEWIFINSKINTSKNDWYIGLRKVDNHWKWVNGKPLKWEKRGELPWHRHEPSGAGNVVKMWDRRGANLFDDARGIRPLGYICEYPNGYEGCKGDSPLKTTSSPLSITTEESTRRKKR